MFCKFCFHTMGHLYDLFVNYPYAYIFFYIILYLSSSIYIILIYLRDKTFLCKQEFTVAYQIIYFWKSWLLSAGVYFINRHVQHYGCDIFCSIFHALGMWEQRTHVFVVVLWTSGLSFCWGFLHESIYPGYRNGSCMSGYLGLFFMTAASTYCETWAAELTIFSIVYREHILRSTCISWFSFVSFPQNTQVYLVKAIVSHEISDVW